MKKLQLKSYDMKTYLLLFLASAICFAMILQQCEYKKLHEIVTLKEVELSTYKDSTKILKSKTGELTSKISTVIVESSNRKKALEIAGFENKELKARDIEWRNVTFALNAKIVALGKGKIILKDSIIAGKTDTVIMQVGKWNDKYLFLEPIVSDNELNFNYRYQTGIKFVVNKNTVSAYLVDPNNPEIGNPFASVITANSITIINKKHWYNNKWLYFGAGVIGGYFISK